MGARIDIWNQAIAALPAEQISSPDENSLEARECRRHYPLIISRMLEGPVDWSFAIKRERLAVLASNDRSGEWGYAYALPADLGTPIRLLPDLNAVGNTVPVALPGEPYAETWAHWDYDIPYHLEGAVLYASAPGALLEYGVSTIDESALPAMVVEAVALELASKLAVPVKSDRKLKLELAQEADLAWQRAMADNLNRQPVHMPSHRSEALAARTGH